MIPTDEQVAAVHRALSGMDSGLWSRGGQSERALIAAIADALSETRYEPSQQERAAAALEIAQAVEACKLLLEEKREREAEQASRDARGTDTELDRLRHWSTVSTYNAGIRRCIAALAARATAA